MTAILKHIDFGNETADDAPTEELLEYFVEQPLFQPFVSSDHRLRIATAKKGVGKSALLKWAAHTIATNDPTAVVVYCRGADLAGIRTSSGGTFTAPNDYIRDWMVKLCALANRHLAMQFKVALSDDAITLVETAELNGFKSKNLVSCLIDRLSTLLPNQGISKTATTDEVALFNRAEKPRLWILVDDLDATFQNTSGENLSIGTFFSACRYLTQDCDDVYIRATMRTDVWAIVRRFDESLDKVEQYVREIVWPLDEFRTLLFKRIKTQFDKLKEPAPEQPSRSSAEEVHRLYFDKLFAPKMIWGDKEQFTYRILYTLAYERPRWAIQLCKLAQAAAVEDHRELIRREHIDEVWAEYGTKRIKDLVAEHKHQCADVEELLNAFRGCERLLSRDDLFALVRNRILSHVTPRIDGQSAGSPMVVAHFLYRIGFIMARSDGDDDHYQHYHHSEMPDFLSSRTDEDFGVKWEIHPCYRQALDIKKLDLSHRRGFRKRRSR
jgi:hypothetical protein